jgi:sterol desaturase/sphingolipid hydroxylase (fatty acid hydroxylase superfamily)
MRTVLLSNFMKFPNPTYFNGILGTLIGLLPSSKCSKSYIYINIPLIIIGLILNVSLTTIKSEVLDTKIAYLFEIMIFWIKNFFLLYMIDVFTRSKPNLIRRDGAEEKHGLYGSIYSILKFSIIEMSTYNIGRRMNLINYKNNSQNSDHALSYDMIECSFQFFAYFISISFLFEIIFDFFHYWSHRYLHENKYLYQNLHIDHHSDKNPSVFHTFNDSIGGTIITNSIPYLLSLLLVSYVLNRSITTSENSLILVYKTFVEISGHSGNKIGKASSFPQFKWLPCIFNMELYTSDHHIHHRYPKSNFSKRFILFDRLFGTFKRGN